MVDLDTAPEMDAGDDLRADLAAAFAGTETAPDTVIDTPASTEPVATAPEAATETETAAAAEQRARDEKGRFAPKAATEPQAAAPQAQPEGPAPVEPTEPPAPVETGEQIAPPPGWSIAAKTKFNALPPEVKDAVAKREAEINKGFAQLTEYKDLKPFAEIARQRNEALPAMVNRLVQAQQALDTNPVGSLLWLARNYGVHPGHLIQAMGGQAQQQQPGQQAPQQQFQPQQQAAPQAPAPQPQDIASMVQNALQEREVSTALKSFLSDPKNTYAENLRPQMAHFLESGQAETLQDAYEMACWATPAIRQELLIKQQATTAPRAAPPVTSPAQAASNARQAAKSVTGSPVSGAPSAVDLSHIDDIDEQLRAAMRAARV